MATQVKELGLGDYVELIKRRWRWIVVPFAVCLALVAAFTFSRDEVYQSRADILVLTETSAGQFALEPAVELRLQRTSIAELQLANAQKYLVSATQSLGYVPDLQLGLLPSADPSKPALSSVVRIVASESSPAAAQASAQIFADNYVAERSQEDLDDVESAAEIAEEQFEDLQQRERNIEDPIAQLRAQRTASSDPIETQQLDAQINDAESLGRPALDSINQQMAAVSGELVELDQTVTALSGGRAATRVINPAYLPLEPTSPNVPRNMILGALIALLFGILLATLRELLDSGANDASELASMADTPIIATVPRLQKSRSAPGGVVPFSLLPDDQASPYRVLLDSMWLSGNGTGIGTIAVTAARTGLGSTQTAVNMAQAEARRGVAVCLVDADFSQPSVLARLGVESDGPGLADLLANRCILDDAITSTEVGKLDVIGAGHVDRVTVDHLRSRRLGDLLEELGKRYELIVVDTSSISALVDSRTVASQCDGVIVVYDHASSKRDDVVTAVEVLRAAHAHPVGLVSNRSNVDQQIHLVDASA